MTDTKDNLVHAIIHSGTFRIGMRRRSCWRRSSIASNVFDDGGYAGETLPHAACKIGNAKWAIEIIKRSDHAKGFEVLLRR